MVPLLHTWKFPLQLESNLVLLFTLSESTAPTIYLLILPEFQVYKIFFCFFLIKQYFDNKASYLFVSCLNHAEALVCSVGMLYVFSLVLTGMVLLDVPPFVARIVVLCYLLF